MHNEYLVLIPQVMGTEDPALGSSIFKLTPKLCSAKVQRNEWWCLQGPWFVQLPLQLYRPAEDRNYVNHVHDSLPLSWFSGDG